MLRYIGTNRGKNLMSQTIMERVAEAKRLVQAITAGELAAIMHRDDVLVVV